MNYRSEFDSLFLGSSQEEKNAASSATAFDIFNLAREYLKLGPEKFLSPMDQIRALPNPGELPWKEIRSGCDQLILGKGLSPTTPLKELGRHEFQLLFQIFHFEICAQESEHLHKDGQNFILDKNLMRNMIHNMKINYYNLLLVG